MIASPRPTTLQEVRGFLNAQHAGTPAWSTAGEALEALYASLRERREDPDFWHALTALLVRLEDARVHPDLIRGAEVLDGATVKALLAELRDALPTDSDGPSDPRSWVRGLRTLHALAAFLLLGVATGCPPTLSGDDDDDDASFDNGCDEADALGYTGDEAAVYCELVNIAEGSGLAALSRADLLECLPTLSAARREQLLDVFRDLSGADLRDALYNLIGGQECSPVVADDDDDH